MWQCVLRSVRGNCALWTDDVLHYFHIFHILKVDITKELIIITTLMFLCDLTLILDKYVVYILCQELREFLFIALVFICVGQHMSYLMFTYLKGQKHSLSFKWHMPQYVVQFLFSKDCGMS